MIHPKISIIIPFYNVENYIAKCINSVKEQTFTDFECLLIDDESVDNSKKIAEKLIENDTRFRIISQQNKGLGGARNTGLDNAKGEWIVFLDSDDWWHSDFLDKMYYYTIQNKVAIINCRYENINKTGKTIGINPSLPAGIYTNKEQLLSFYLTYPTAWNKFYKKELWDDLRFPEKVFYEDLPTIFQLVFKTKNILFIDDILVCYNLREGSITKHFSNKQISDRITIFNIIKQTFKEQNIENDLYLINYVYILHIIYITCCDVLQFQTKVSKKSLLKEFHKLWDKNYFNPQSIWKIHRRLGMIKSLLLIIYYFSPILFFYIFKLKNKLKR